MKTKNLLLMFAILFIASISSCATDDFQETIGVCPVVQATSPINGATGVSFNPIITVTFNEEMDAATINQSSFTITGTGQVAGSITYSGTTASFTPTIALSPNTTYTGRVSTASKDVMGNALQEDYVWTFKTGIAPTVTATDPINNAIGVNLNKIITADFSIAMDPLTLNATTFIVRQGTVVIPGIVAYSGTTASFTPSIPLTPGTIYTATITTGARNTAGIALANNYVWNFTTVSPAVITTVPTAATGLFFGVFGGNAGITNQGLNTVINGNIGTTAASTLVTGFHDGTTGDVYTETPLNKGLVNGRIHTAPPTPGSATSEAIATQGLADANAAYISISPAQKPGGTDPGAGELGNLVLPPGIYKSAGATFKISLGDLTLDAKGDPNAVWIFQTAAGLTVGIAGPTGAKNVNLVNGAQAKNVFWYVGSSAVINGAGGGVMTGTIIASAGVTFSTPGNAVQTVLNGRAISLVASVTMVNTTINVPAN
ncbi:ice-binding family protein [Flavobacterium yafengii]|uniref:ice-binding family protein n=1 Tax=Flavobacterium yafengii TaxID=3041253 RepID=UPI0024A9DA45|nr:ice-binding family protein [Flavobacterium yafengii]MDI5889238.1 ice-binding family protein [Flavobacterium yafengii]